MALDWRGNPKGVREILSRIVRGSETPLHSITKTFGKGLVLFPADADAKFR